MKINISNTSLNNYREVDQIKDNKVTCNDVKCNNIDCEECIFNKYDYTVKYLKDNGRISDIDCLKLIVGDNEAINDRDIQIILEMAEHYYKRSEFTYDELESTVRDFCYQWDIEINV
ncbi:hypothetical protein [Terrisporobacter sp.]|uniref:hypothetical protein n=1 Tax=Terrisporobacter sp. TaxID=1965305 RepID=UPI002899A5B3|nr:hypothetical protein [Terrisporobacter sp.]